MDRATQEFFRAVPSGVVTDAMLLLGLEGWTTGILPLRPGSKLFGPAFTVQAAGAGVPNYSIYELSALWKPGDVMVIDGLDAECALMGENMAHRCQYEGLAGLVLNGRCRDCAEIRALDLPVFGRGPAMRLRKGLLDFSACQVPLQLAGARVAPGDFLLGDEDGVPVFPAGRAGDIHRQARMILEVESRMEEAMRLRLPAEEIAKIAGRKSAPRP